MPRVVMLKQDGTEAYELNPDDYSMKMDGTDSDYKNTAFAGNVMVAFPQVWLKYEQVGNRQHYYIANMQVDSSYHCYTHYNKNGQLVDWIYKAAYKGANVNNVIRSISGLTPMNTQTSATERSYCQANGDRWFTGVMADRLMINTLCCLWEIYQYAGCIRTRVYRRRQWCRFSYGFRQIGQVRFILWH